MKRSRAPEDLKELRVAMIALEKIYVYSWLINKTWEVFQMVE